MDDQLQPYGLSGHSAGPAAPGQASGGTPPAGLPPEEDEKIHLRDYLHILSGRRWILAAIFTGVLAAAVISNFMERPVYTATATIKIDKGSPNILAFKGAYESSRNDDDYYQTQYKILKSRNIAARVIRKLDLGKRREFKGGPSALKEGAMLIFPFLREDGGRRGGQDTQDLVKPFLKRVRVSPVPNSQLVNVSFTAHDPALARDAANAIAGAYIDYNVESAYDAGRQARSWLEQQIKIMKARLKDSEEALNQYAAGNQMLYIEDKNRIKQSLVNYTLGYMAETLDQAVAERIDKEARYTELKDAGTDSREVIDNLLIQRMEAQYAALVAEYNNELKTFKPSYPRMKNLQSQINSMAASIRKDERSIFRSVKGEYLAAVKKQDTLKRAFDRQKKAAIDFQKKMVEYQILKREVDTNQALYLSLLQRLKEITVSATMTSTNIQVLDRAQMPKRPSAPRKARNLVLALFLGVTGGVGAAFFAEYLDNTVKDAQEIERKMKMAPLGAIPHKKKIGLEELSIVSHSDNKGPMAEAFRSVGTFILFSSASRPPKTILITSPREGEGKTTVSCNTSIALTKYLGKGIIIDGDLRRASLHRIFGLGNGGGLSTYLSGNMEFGEEGLIRNTPVPALDVITAGPVPPNPSELLGSARMKELLERLGKSYNFVIIDSAPVLGMADSVCLGSFVDGVIAVAQSGRTTRDSLKEAKKVLEYVNAKVLGLVINGVRGNGMKYGYYSYYSPYSRDDGQA